MSGDDTLLSSGLTLLSTTKLNCKSVSRSKKPPTLLFTEVHEASDKAIAAIAITLANFSLPKVNFPKVRLLILSLPKLALLKLSVLKLNLLIIFP